MKRLAYAAAVLAILAALPSLAHAFCGFYVNKAGGQLYANATRVVLMRDGKTTALTMQNNYEGPPKDFAMVIPVPQILQKDNVKTLPHNVMDNIDKVTAPRLVEYWKQRPRPRRGSGMGGRPMMKSMAPEVDMVEKKVVVEAEFTAGEYNIVILSAKEATALETWLNDAKYNIPKGAGPYFEPYIQAGMYFFVARVDASKVKFQDGKALLSPLRFHYESDEFALPIRLGLINAKGEQDLIVYTLGKGQRYEVANRKNVFVPTNIEVDKAVKDNFAGFYESVFANTIKQNKGAVVTEYSWQATNCDPCPPGGALNQNDIMQFGGDVLGKTAEVYQVSKVVNRDDLLQVQMDNVVRRYDRQIRQCSEQHLAAVGKNKVILNLEFSPTGYMHKITSSYTDSPVSQCIIPKLESLRIPRSEEDALRNVYVELSPTTVSLQPPSAREFVVTRLHARYKKDEVTSDLVFKKAPAVVGGREINSGQGLEMGANPANMNNFQGRYIIRHDEYGPRYSVSTPQPPVKQTRAPKKMTLKNVIKQKDLSRLKVE